MVKWLILLVCICAGCAEGPPKTATFKNVERIFMHEKNHYSWLYRDGDELKHELFHTCYNCPGFKIIDDVPDGEPMWVQTTTEGDWMSSAEIHVHSVENIDGGNWKRGKHGRGSTNVLE